MSSHTVTRSARAIRLAMTVLPTVVVLVTVALTTGVAVTLQERSIREATAERVHDVAANLAQLREVQTALTAAIPAGSPDDLADADDLSTATVALQPLADLVTSTAGVYYVVITDDEGVRITHPDVSQRGVQVTTANESVLAGEEFVGTEQGASGSSLRAKVPVRAEDGEVVGMVAVGVLESSISAERDEAIGELLPWAVGALVTGTLASSVIAALIERRLRRSDRIQAEHDQMRRITGVLREQSHEFGTRLHVIHGLVSRGETTDALRYIDTVMPVLTTERSGEPASHLFLLSALTGTLGAELASSGTHLENAGDEDIAIDERVVLVLANLCRNAAEAGATRVRCTVRENDGRIRGVVEDDGPGIAPRDAEQIFERGFSSKDDTRGVGRGIGLDLVRRTITESGGTILLGRSVLGGARFEFEMGSAL